MMDFWVYEPRGFFCIHKFFYIDLLYLYDFYFILFVVLFFFLGFLDNVVYATHFRSQYKNLFYHPLFVFDRETLSYTFLFYSTYIVLLFESFFFLFYIFIFLFKFKANRFT